MSWSNRNCLLIVCLLVGVTLHSSRADDLKSPQGVVVDENQDHIQNNVIPQSSTHYPTDLSIPSSLISMLANGGAVAAVILAASLLALVVGPSFGLRLCTLFGNCQDSPVYQAYSATPYTDYQNYQQGTYNNPVYQKRSLEYVGPVLRALSNAYDKYQKSIQNKSK